MKHPFLLGALGYPLLEICARGRTHWSMALAGGASCAAIRRIGQSGMHPLGKALAGGLAITGIEALCGCLWNRRHQVWDYRRQPLNWRGQVCLRYSALWCLMAAGILYIDNLARRA